MNMRKTFTKLELKVFDNNIILYIQQLNQAEIRM